MKKIHTGNSFLPIDCKTGINKTIHERKNDPPLYLVEIDDDYKDFDSEEDFLIICEWRDIEKIEKKGREE